MKLKVSTTRNDKGIAFKIFFLTKRTYKNELEGLFEVFFIRWGLIFHFGPQYLVG